MKSQIMNFIFKPANAQGSGSVIVPQGDPSKKTLPGVEPGTGSFDSLASVLTFAINTVFIIGLSLSLLFVIVGGIKYVTSSGDEGKATEARNTITNAVIGAVVIIGFRVILAIVTNLLGWTDFIPGAE
jgi:hypothetical protein